MSGALEKYRDNCVSPLFLGGYNCANTRVNWGSARTSRGYKYTRFPV